MANGFWVLADVMGVVKEYGDVSEIITKTTNRPVRLREFCLEFYDNVADEVFIPL